MRTQPLKFQQDREYLMNVYRAKLQQLEGLKQELQLMRRMLGLRESERHMRGQPIKGVDDAEW